MVKCIYVELKHKCTNMTAKLYKKKKKSKKKKKKKKMI